MKTSMDEPLISVAAMFRRIAALLAAGKGFESPEVAAVREEIDSRYGAYRE